MSIDSPVRLSTAAPPAVPVKRTSSGRPARQKVEHRPLIDTSQPSSSHVVETIRNAGESRLFPSNREWAAIECLKLNTDEDILKWLDWARYPGMKSSQNISSPDWTDVPTGLLDRRTISQQSSSGFQSYHPPQRDSSYSSIASRSSVISASSARTSYSSRSFHAPDNPHLDIPPLPKRTLQPSSDLPSANDSPTNENSARLSTQSSNLQTKPLPIPPAPPQPKYYCTCCDDKGFYRKGDWKSHEREFHEHQEEYSCTFCTRKDYAKQRFIRHHANTHGCKDCPHVDACRTILPKKRAWGCGFCGRYLKSWSDRIDHIANHYETGKQRSEWNHTNVMIGLLSQPLLHDIWDSLVRVTYGTYVELSWSKSATRQLQASLEFEGPQTADSIAQEALRLARATPHPVPQIETITPLTYLMPSDNNSRPDSAPIFSTQEQDSGQIINTRSDSLSYLSVPAAGLGLDEHMFDDNGYFQPMLTEGLHDYAPPVSPLSYGGYEFPPVPR